MAFRSICRNKKRSKLTMRRKKVFTHLIHCLEGSSDPVPQRGGGVCGGSFHLVELDLVVLSWYSLKLFCSGSGKAFKVEIILYQIW